MTRLLHLDSSILAEQSSSRRLTADIVEKLKRDIPGLQIAYRDLGTAPPPHLSGAFFGARAGAFEPQDERLLADLAIGRELVEEFLAAEIVVIGAPMYNFSVPAQLKAWVDQILVPGKTFSYTAEGIQGLAGGKRVILVSTRGGVFSVAPRAAFDHQENYLRAVFATIGLPDIEIVRAEGLALGPEQKERAIEDARSAISALKAA